MVKNIHWCLKKICEDGDRFLLMSFKKLTVENFSDYLCFIEKRMGEDIIFNIAEQFESSFADEVFDVSDIWYRPKKNDEKFSRRGFSISNHTEEKGWILTIGYFFDEENCTEEEINNRWKCVPYFIEFLVLKDENGNKIYSANRDIEDVPEEQLRNKRIGQK